MSNILSHHVMALRRLLISTSKEKPSLSPVMNIPELCLKKSIYSQHSNLVNVLLSIFLLLLLTPATKSLFVSLFSTQAIMTSLQMSTEKTNGLILQSYNYLKIKVTSVSVIFHTVCTKKKKICQKRNSSIGRRMRSSGKACCLAREICLHASSLSGCTA